MKKWKSQIKELGLEQRDVAKYLGYHVAYFNRLVNGKTPAPANFELRLSLALTVLARAELEADKARHRVLSS